MLEGSGNFVTWIFVVITAAVAGLVQWITGVEWQTLGVVILGGYISLSPRLVKEWERGVVLRLGKYRGVLPPGITFVIPGVDRVVNLMDMRIRFTAFSAERTLTRDTVPVNVDAVLFWIVTDAKKSVLEVQRLTETVSWVAQTTLRDVIGKTELVRMISDRATLDEELQGIIDGKTSEWGITVQSVEIRDVIIPSGLEDAMSRKAQADREKEARVVLAESEVLVAREMERASEVYHRSAEAMRLRAMNMTYESIKERGALMVIPSTMAESMNAGMLGVAAAGFKLDKETP